MINILKTMEANTDSELTKEVIGIILDEAGESDEEIMAYLENVTTYGCVNGTVSSLIYYCDTGAFFDKYADECLEIANNYIDMCDGRVTFELTRNNLAWIAFETVAGNIFSILSE